MRFNPSARDFEDCPSCDGTGMGSRSDGSCTWCSGKGRRRTRESLDEQADAEFDHWKARRKGEI